MSSRLPSVLALASALSLSPSPAQQKPPAPTFHVPAGEHTLAHLIDQAQNALRVPIACSRDTLDAAVEPSVHLQAGLRLDATGWEDVLSALLFARGLVLTRSPDRKGIEVLPVGDGRGAWIAERAETVTLAELLARPARCRPVRVTVPFAAGLVVATTMLRPMMAMKDAPMLDLAEAEGGCTLTGLNGEVLQCLRSLAPADPELQKALAPAAPPAWPRPLPASRHRLPAGTFSARELVDLLARELGRNILLRALDLELAGKPVKVETERELDALAFEDAVTALLWQQDVLVTAVSAEHGLYEALPVAGERIALAAPRALPMHAAEVVARPGLVAMVSVPLQPAHLDQAAALAVLRPRLMQAPEGLPRELSTTIVGFEKGFLCQGLISRLAPAVTDLLAADAAAAAPGKGRRP